jgi:hypothetical protein
MTFDVEQWRALRRVGIVDIEREIPAECGEEPLAPFELRNCSACGSSVAKTVPYAGGSMYP